MFGSKLSNLILVLASAAALSSCAANSSKNSSMFKEVNSYKGGPIKVRVADAAIASAKKSIEFPLKIAENFEVVSIDVDDAYFNNNQKKILWKAKLRNPSDKEVAISLNLCSSVNAVMEIVKNNRYYLVDCKEIDLRYNPDATTTNSITFASARPWKQDLGSMAKLCIKDVGCVSRYLAK